MTRITLTLKDDEKIALRALAEREFRDPRAQAALIIRRELEKQGLIMFTNPPALDAPGADEIMPLMSDAKRQESINERMR